MLTYCFVISVNHDLGIAVNHDLGIAVNHDLFATVSLPWSPILTSRWILIFKWIVKIETPIAQEMIPTARLLVYAIDGAGHVISDSLSFPVHPVAQHQVQFSLYTLYNKIRKTCPCTLCTTGLGKLVHVHHVLQYQVILSLYTLYSRIS